ncbi:MscS mechanosensitive ion channel [Melioribacter roseus P3M-2]|uniref:MscS mechanosensitive ion channel n=1 Tax=Melioribacter roseus (strain DSM 23840 / JCM 17771 / VKM B-2668 / P3M-2) TaxID=1191523 RepID=I7A206_MELRP|nr:mechanosensitive ion channel family protein [Melioribacter roseus]AFN75268.1 MscS mechanosensitive ion channel [Melioribacter roseus P3M-2]
MIYRNIIGFLVLLLFSLYGDNIAVTDSTGVRKYPVTLESDTLFYIGKGIGAFNAEKRAREISAELNNLLQDESFSPDSIKLIKGKAYWNIAAGENIIMSVTPEDADFAGISDSLLAAKRYSLIINGINKIKSVNKTKILIYNIIYNLVYLILMALFFWGANKIFPRINRFLGIIAPKILPTIRFKGRDIVKKESMVKALDFTAKGIRFVLSLLVIYLFIIYTLQLWPVTRSWDLQPIIKSLALLIFYTVLFYAIWKGINSLSKVSATKIGEWKGTKIKSLKIKNIEVLNEDRIIEILLLGNKILKFALLLFSFYTYLTIIFSLFTFSSHWAETLLGYILNPLNTVWTSFINFLPNLFFIVVLVFVFNYLIKAVKFIFNEIDRGTLEIPGFHKDWAVPTYKIVRFLILVLAVIIIFPYLPGSDSPFFQGISVFLGILFSLGSSSAISNMVAGVVLTYMRPFKLGDRVKIADTIGDVVEKTLLVTRIRTTKNVDITIPNSMVLGSHIINFSSSSEDKGLILHTTVTIGYDVPWKKVHELLIAAANETEHIKKDPRPFVLQTSLDDFYVSYELNAYTDKPQMMQKIYSELHSMIQDKFNEAGVEILSPHYSALRDGNQITIPQDYLPKTYQAPPFRIFGVNFGGNKENKE